MDDIERYDFWHRESYRLQLAFILKDMSLNQLPRLEKERKDFIDKGCISSWGTTIDYYDKAIDSYLQHLHKANRIIKEEQDKLFLTSGF